MVPRRGCVAVVPCEWAPLLPSAGSSDTNRRHHAIPTGAGCAGCLRRTQLSWATLGVVAADTVRSSLFGLEVLVVVVVLVVSEVEGAGNGSAGGVVVNASCRGASDHASRPRDGPVPDAGGR